MDKISWPIAISAGMLFVAISTFLLNFVFKKNQKLREEQQKAIADLIKWLGGNSIEFGFVVVNDLGSGGNVFRWTLLDIGKTNLVDIVPEFDDAELYFHYESNRIKGIKEFIEDPFIPSEIKKVLQNFHPISYDNEVKSILKSPEPFVSVSTGYFVEMAPFELESNKKPNQLKFPRGAIAYASWLSFKTSCKSLVREINRHLDKINASGLKIS